jgi:hypothetical protein
MRLSAAYSIHTWLIVRANTCQSIMHYKLPGHIHRPGSVYLVHLGEVSNLIWNLPSHHQTIEEGAVVLQGLAEVFSRDIIALFPLALQ